MAPLPVAGPVNRARLEAKADQAEMAPTEMAMATVRAKVRVMAKGRVPRDPVRVLGRLLDLPVDKATAMAAAAVSVAAPKVAVGQTLFPQTFRTAATTM